MWISEKLAVAIVVGMLSLAIVVVAITEHRDESEPKKGSWEIGFIEPENNESLDFFVANFSEENGSFSYEIIVENTILSSGKENVLFGETKEIAITEEAIITQDKGMYRIEVRNDSNESREIYRRL